MNWSLKQGQKVHLKFSFFERLRIYIVMGMWVPKIAYIKYFKEDCVAYELHDGTLVVPERVEPL